ncbi:MAG: glycosyltransferase family 39 protein, partial [Rhizobiales bacterium]|nr:glycosyltransferase family 39 protein [Hyphomicrobiales bacterium]
MLSISLFVELLRTRPLVLFWAMALLQVVLWTLVPLLFYSSPPGELPVVLAIGHEFQIGTEFGPPLAFWLAEIVYRAAGMVGVYLLSQVCVVVTFWAVLRLGRAIVGDAHAVIAVLLMAGIAVFSAPTVEFGPAILAAPLWALLLLHVWLGAQRNDWRYWVAAGLEAGLLLLTTYAGLILVGLVVVYLLASRFGREQLVMVGPWLAGLVAVSVMFPYLTWLDLSGGARLIGLSMLFDNLRSWGWLVLAVVASHAGMGILVVLGRSPATGSDRAPEVLRSPLDPAARIFVVIFALVPVVAMGLFALFSHRPENFVAVPLVVMSALAGIVMAGDRIRIGYQYAIGYVWL